MNPHHLIHRFAYMKNEIPVAGCAHQAGTVRFGADPATSVLNTDCRAHEVDNLYVVDTSFFPSIGAVNPALTAMANALRVGDHLLAAAALTPCTNRRAPSGEQIELVHADQRAVVVEVGGGLRTYSAGGRDLLDGYALDAPSTSGRGQVLAPWPNRLEDGSYEFDGRRLPARADRAGTAQRHSRSRALGVSGRSPSASRTGS